MRKEREFYLTTDKAFKITLFLKNYPGMERFIVLLTNSVAGFIRKIRPKKSAKANKTILVLTLHRIGDTVFTIPAIRSITNYYSGDNIKIICFNDTKPILEEEFNKEILVGINKNDLKFHRKIPGSETRRLVKSLDPDIIYDLTGMPLSALIILLSRARKVYGRNIKYLKSIYDVFTPLREKPHFFDAFFDVVRNSLPSEYHEDNFEFPRNKSDSSDIIIHPFGIRQAKEWNLRKFLILAERLSERFPVTIVSPPDYVSQDIKSYIYQCKNLKLVISSDLRELISIIRTGAIYIGNDSGPTYIASLLGIPTFTIYGPTNPDFSFPFGEYHSYIIKHLNCSAVNDKVCDTLGGIYCPSNECMQLLKVDEVEMKLNSFIKELGIKEKH